LFVLACNVDLRCSGIGNIENHFKETKSIKPFVVYVCQRVPTSLGMFGPNISNAFLSIYFLLCFINFFRELVISTF